MLAGNVAALLSPIVFVPILTYAFGPQNYDWVSMAEIRKSDDSDLAAAAHVDLELIPGEITPGLEAAAAEQAALARSAKIARSLTAFLAISLLVLWPMPMYGSAYIFSKKFFTGWIIVAILWLFCSIAVVGLYPLWESRTTFFRTVKMMIRDMSGKPIRPIGRENEVEETEATVVEGKEKESPAATGDVTPTSGEEEKKVEAAAEK